MFSLEECSDIEPISEDDEVDGPICEVQVISMNNIVCQPLVEWHCRVPMVTCNYMEIPLVKANCYKKLFLCKQYVIQGQPVWPCNLIE